MSLLKIDQHQRRILGITTFAAILVGLWFLRGYIMLILFATVVALLFNPVYQWLLRKNNKPHTAAFYTFMLSLLVVMIPIALVGVITFVQIDHLVATISVGDYPQQITSMGTSIIDNTNRWLADLGVSFRISIDAIAGAIATGAQNFGRALIGGLVSSVSGFFGFITAGIIYIYVFLSIIVHQDKILDTLKKLNPLGDSVSNVYLNRIDAMTKATVRGQFIIAICQGTVSAGVLALAGLPDLFFFMWMLLTVLSVIPLGAGIVTIPIGIVMILTGHVWQGIVVIANHLVIVTNIDNVLRPILVPREARLDSALMLLGVFAGMSIFGFFGIVLGPVLMIILVTTIQMYLEVFRDTKAIDNVQSKKRRVVSRLAFWRTTLH